MVLKDSSEEKSFYWAEHHTPCLQLAVKGEAAPDTGVCAFIHSFIHSFLDSGGCLGWKEHDWKIRVKELVERTMWMNLWPWAQSVRILLFDVNA